MTNRLDQARDSADDLARWLDAANPTEPLDEDRLDELISHISGDVKGHNDELAEAAMADDDDGGES